MLRCLYVLHINSIHTKCTKHSEQHVNLDQLMNTPKSELNWSPSNQMQHTWTQPGLIGKYLSWHSLALFWSLTVEQVSTPLHNRHTVRGAETKAMYQFSLKQVAHLCALATRWPKKTFIHYFNWPLPATAAKTSAPDVTSQSPMSESFGGIFFLPNFHGNQTFPSQARRPLHRGSTAKLRSIQSRREDKWCESRLLERYHFPLWPHQEGRWNPRPLERERWPLSAH